MSAKRNRPEAGTSGPAESVLATDTRHNSAPIERGIKAPSQSITDFRKQMRAAGLVPIPVNGKIPVLDEWQKKTKTDDDEIERWEKVYPNAQNTGLLTRDMPTLDADILNQDAAEAVEALVRNRFEERGRILVRIGLAPKRAIPFRTDNPFKKITVNLVAPDGATGQKLELLADGQQLVGFGIHPDTGKPYTWHGAEAGAKLKELPHITEAEARTLVDDAAKLLTEKFGYQVASDGKKGNGKSNSSNYPPATPEKIKAALNVIPSDDEEIWFRVGYAIWKELGEDGYDLFEEWSKKSVKYNTSKCAKKWRAFAKYDYDYTAGTIFHQAKEASPGWRASPNDDLTEEQQKEIARLAALSLVQYDQQRIAAADKLGIRVSTLDQLVERARPPSNDVAGQGTPLSFAPVDPWPEPVDGEKLVADLEVAIRKHVVLSEQQALAVAFWILHAHALEFAEHSPRLHVPSPAARCGKTTLLNTIAAMVPKPIRTENITTSALFRVIESVQPTLLIDEADIFLKDNEDMRGLLNAGHGRSGTVIRTVGENFEPRGFKVWAPVVVAGIGRIPATIEDRSITISLRRRLPNEKIERLRTNSTGHLAVLGRRAARWVADHRTALADADPALPDKLGDREQDNWRPLVAIADAISKELSQRVKDAAVAIASEEEDDENKSIMVLADVAAIFELKNTDKISSEELVQTLIDMEDRPWAEWRRGKPMTKNSLARLLKPFSIHPKPIRFEPKPAATRSGYLVGAITEAKSRYVDHEVTLTEKDTGESVPDGALGGNSGFQTETPKPTNEIEHFSKNEPKPGFRMKKLKIK